eukprot:m.234096 g.234096  ORF g.234096 m.234096 type:complete len:581 (-) comp16032_c0_seq19:40-1782(-)
MGKGRNGSSRRKQKRKETSIVEIEARIDLQNEKRTDNENEKQKEEIEIEYETRNQTQAQENLNEEQCEDFSIAIIGGGPHGLAVLSALHEKSFAHSQYADDAAYSLRVGFDAFELVGKACVIDPGASFMCQWKKQFEMLDIEYLRSPLFAHPEAYDEYALMNYAIQQGRTDEIKARPYKSADMHSKKHGLGNELHSLPSTKLFNDFCASLAERLPHTWLQGLAVDIKKTPDGEKYEVQYEKYIDNGSGVKVPVTTTVRANAVVLALGPRGTPNIPTPFMENIKSSSGRIVHTRDLFDESKNNGGSLRESVARVTAALGKEATRKPVLVIGGGLTAAQSAIAAVRAGARVELRSRRPLVTRDYDVSNEWLDRRHMHRKRFEFLTEDMQERPQFMKSTIGGGSVPKSYLTELSELARTTGRLKMEVKVDIDSSDDVHISSDNTSVFVAGKEYSQVILATGEHLNPLGSSQLLQKLQNRIPTEFVSNFPVLDCSLRWTASEDIFVIGSYASMQLGPGALNLMGAMRGAQLVGEELHSKLWKDRRSKPSKTMEYNCYALLGVESESESELEEDGIESSIQCECA